MARHDVLQQSDVRVQVHHGLVPRAGAHAQTAGSLSQPGTRRSPGYLQYAWRRRNGLIMSDGTSWKNHSEVKLIASTWVTIFHFSSYFLSSLLLFFSLFNLLIPSLKLMHRRFN